ncbi:alpha/beta hydrolase [Anaerocolumna cellulosilytica]|uniref:Alpha/beta hydrolase n=1 Tax=Anaerocolumna cellulosilytica TaxID=433286 RepID=A0A6S6R3M1_9FIRM|nr:glycoside hydrolase family 95 protein [Anaerocolumna cellulosilytica]MBB5196698.1 alpha-L-fucosidase 2 [Anaerocolumna cellulosilytica]BCJ93960.1 alpha/beta hydrolase [Anaerocolumna cellulosilytica]
MKYSTMFYTKPADVNPRNPEAWNDALPIGNGSLGGMVFGGIEKERIQLNEDTLWYGSGGRDRVNPDSMKYLQEIRNLLKAGKIKEAQRLGELSMVAGPEGERNYTTAGDVTLNFELDKEAATDYKRTLDLEKAIAGTTYKLGGVIYEREAFVSNVHNVLVVRMKASEKGALHFILALSRAKYLNENKAVGDNKIQLSGIEGGNGVSFCVAAKVVDTDGKVYTIGNRVLLEEASEATLLLTIRTSYYGENPEKWCEKTLEAAQQYSYDELKTEHIKDYQALYNRMSLTMKEDKDLAELPIDERLQKVKDGQVDLGLIAMYFNFGRYLLISCSRPGTMAANLQGIWNKDFNPPWDSKFTININTEMNYWPAEICNLSECHMPLFDLLTKMLPSGKKVAEKMYGCRGFVAHHNTDVWGDCAPQDIYMPATIWPMGAAWLTTHIWEHYLFTLDEAFLRTYFELIRECALFFRDYLFENEEGQLVTGPSVSPENTYIHPSGDRGTLCIGPSMDSQIITDIFKQYLEAARILRLEDDLGEEVKAMISKLPKPSVGKHGQIKEWAVDYEEAELGHRHISHLYALYPSNQLTYERTPELMKNARITLERRLSNGGGHTGWSRAWIINMWARLRDGEEAGKNVQAILAKSTAINLFDMHPPFQIDGNFGACAGIAEMLVQSQAEIIHFLPALPDTWVEGTIMGIKARGNIEMDVSWKDGEVTKLVIRSLSGRAARFVAPNSLWLKNTEGEVTIKEEEAGFLLAGNGSSYSCCFEK